MQTVRLLFALLLLALAEFAWADPYPLTVESKHAGKEIWVIGHNQGYSSVSIKAVLTEQENIASDQRWPVYAVLPPQRDTTIARIYAADKNRGYRFSTSVSSLLGDFNAQQDSTAMYRLPYQDGSSHVIGQAIDGVKTTHNTPLSLYAVDFNMAEGTPIVAARGGVVVQTIDQFTQGANDPALVHQANSIRIQHADGTHGSYAHLMHQGVAVKVGQQVQAGEVIGYAGSTGYSSGPHLHFAVSRVIKTEQGLDEVSIPFLFYVGNPAFAFEPRQRMKVSAYYNKPGENPALAQPEIVGKTATEALQPLPVSASRTEMHLSLVDYAALIAIALITLYFLLKDRLLIRRQKELKQTRASDE